jgi:hypothetical protein
LENEGTKEEGSNYRKERESEKKMKGRNCKHRKRKRVPPENQKAVRTIPETQSTNVRGLPAGESGCPDLSEAEDKRVVTLSLKGSIQGSEVGDSGRDHPALLAPMLTGFRT